MDNFLKWKNEGAYSPVVSCLTAAIQCTKPCANMSDKSNPFTGDTDPMSAGNGGLMRLAPAIQAARSEDEAIKYAVETTRLTHGAEEALMYSKSLAKELWRRQPDAEVSDTNIIRILAAVMSCQVGVKRLSSCMVGLSIIGKF